MFGLHAWFAEGSRVSARQPPYFPLLAHRIAGRSKVSKGKGSLLPASLRCAAGNLWCSPVECAAELATRLVSASLRQLRRVRWTKHVRHEPHMPPHRLRASAQVEGCGGRQPLDFLMKYGSGAYAASAGSYEFGIDSLSRLRERAGVRGIRAFAGKVGKDAKAPLHASSFASQSAVIHRFLQAVSCLSYAVLPWIRPLKSVCSRRCSRFKEPLSTSTTAPYSHPSTHTTTHPAPGAHHAHAGRGWAAGVRSSPPCHHPA